MRISPFVHRIGALITAIVPLAFAACGGSPASDATLLAELEASMQRHLIDAWYPRSVDTENGGYWSAFDADWNPVEGEEKFIVTQSRHVWMTAQLGLFTGESRFRTYAEHGYAFLRDAMWDNERGGFLSKLSSDGRAVTSREKSAYGNAFAIYALASYHELTGDEAALDLAKRAFHWLETHSWDAEFGGYVDRLNDDGSWNGSSDEKRVLEIFEHRGLKDYNSTIHLLEAFTALYQRWPDALLRKRLHEMLALTRDRFALPQGYLQLYYFRDWTPVSLRGESRQTIFELRHQDHVSWGHDVETAYLMLEASHVLGIHDDEKTRAAAKRLVDHALATGWDSERGGLYEAGYYFAGEDSCSILNDEKVWWVEAEALNAFLLFSKLYPENSSYRNAFEKQWRYCKENLIDAERGGWYASGLDTHPEASKGPKAYLWKANYHDGRSYLNCIRMLRGESGLAPSR